MEKLRIGIFINEDYDPKIGGAFSYYERLIEKINNFKFDDKIEIVFLSKSKIDSTNFNKKIVEIPYYKFSLKNWTLKLKIINKLFSFSVLKYLKISQKIENKIAVKINHDVTNFLKFHKIDLIYYVVPNFYPLEYPFITTHWDLGHKTTFAFPEIIANNKFKNRERYHRVTLQKSFAIFAESDRSKKELIKIEGINKDRIFVVPLFAGRVVELDINQERQNTILYKWQVQKNKFYFYPAQFWAHKNHFGLLKAFEIVKEKHKDYKLVLSGSDKGNLNYVKQIVENLGLSESVIFTGFVPDEDIYSFYKNAIALVMPTYLGPTNMPLLEAYYLGCPVLGSNLKGHKVQMKEKAVYFDPVNYNDIALKMLEIITPKNVTQNKIENINLGEILNQHFNSIYNIRKTFGYEY